MNPDTSIIDLSFSDLSETQAKILCEQCSAHEGLKINLEVTKAEFAAMGDLFRLISKSKVRKLALNELSNACVGQLAPVLGRVEHMLSLCCINFDIQSEKSMGESLVNSEGLKHLKLLKCDFGPSGGMQFLEGMTLNQSIQTLHLIQTSIIMSPRADFSDFLEKTKTLKSLWVQSGINENVAVDSILIGALRNSSLQSLSIIQWNTISFDHPENLVQLLEENKALVDLTFNVIHFRLNDFPDLINSLKKNTSLLYFKFGDEWNMSLADKQIIKDILDRNRALAKKDYLQKAGQVFDPTGAMANGISDVGAVMARHILENSASVVDFGNTMTEIELAIREIERQAAVTNTTTTTTPKPGSASY